MKWLFRITFSESGFYCNRNCHITNFDHSGFSFFAQTGFRLIGFSLKQVVTLTKITCAMQSGMAWRWYYPCTEMGRLPRVPPLPAHSNNIRLHTLRIIFAHCNIKTFITGVGILYRLTRDIGLMIWSAGINWNRTEEHRDRHARSFYAADRFGDLM